jgi:hypothetical protein
MTNDNDVSNKDGVDISKSKDEKLEINVNVTKPNDGTYKEGLV